ncbi:hypothetical protein D0T66_10775 [Dysgonomonas sp. 25]|nr:hypothetical protein [Dysgonomonas sp. 25]
MLCFFSCKEEVQLPADSVSVGFYDFIPQSYGEPRDTIFYGLKIYGAIEVNKDFNVKIVRRTYPDGYLLVDTLLSDEQKKEWEEMISYYLEKAQGEVPLEKLPPRQEADCVCDGPFIYLLIEKEGMQPAFVLYRGLSDVPDRLACFFHDKNDNGISLSETDSVMTEIKKDVFVTLLKYDNALMEPNPIMRELVSPLIIKE